jgi:hypothetical protein
MALARDRILGAAIGGGVSRPLLSARKPCAWTTGRTAEGVVNLLPVDRINEHEGARLPGSSPECSGEKARDVLPGVESFPHRLRVFEGGEKVTSRAEVLGDRTIRRDPSLRWLDIQIYTSSIIKRIHEGS